MLWHAGSDGDGACEDVVVTLAVGSVDCGAVASDAVVDVDIDVDVAVEAGTACSLSEAEFELEHAVNKSAASKRPQ